MNGSTKLKPSSDNGRHSNNNDKQIGCALAFSISSDDKFTLPRYLSKFKVFANILFRLGMESLTMKKFQEKSQDFYGSGFE